MRRHKKAHCKNYLKSFRRITGSKIVFEKKSTSFAHRSACNRLAKSLFFITHGAPKREVLCLMMANQRVWSGVGSFFVWWWQDSDLSILKKISAHPRLLLLTTSVLCGSFWLCFGGEIEVHLVRPTTINYNNHLHINIHVNSFTYHQKQINKYTLCQCSTRNSRKIWSWQQNETKQHAHIHA